MTVSTVKPITAAEASKISSSHGTSLAAFRLRSIFTDIRLAAQKGQTSVEVMKSVSKQVDIDVNRALTDLGYKISGVGDNWLINWN